MQTITWDEWKEKGKKLFGDKFNNWKFKCVSCGNTQSISDFIKEGLPEGNAAQAVYQECIGRYDKNKGCNWCLYGLLKIHELEVIRGEDKIPVFKFAEEEE